MATTIRRRLICFLRTIYHLSSIGSESGGPPEASIKLRLSPPRNIEIATKWPSHDEFARNFPSITCLLSYPGSDDALHRLSSVYILISTSSLLIDCPQNLATDLQEQVMPKQNKEEMYKTRENFLHRPTYYHGEATMIKYCGYWTFVVRFYPYLCQFSPS